MIFILARELFGDKWRGQDCLIKGIACDSRRIKEGYIFVCICGENDSGCRYIREAESRGAVAIIADRTVDARIPVFLCHNPRKKMAEYAKKIYSFGENNIYIVGVTGTNGKTTITHLIRDIFNEDNKKTALIGTNGCYLDDVLTDDSFTTSTTPEAPELWSILKSMHELGARNAVMEISSHALSMDRVLGMKFDVGVFSNLTMDHMDFHKNMENYFKAKEKLFEMSEMCAINTDDEYGKRLYEKYREKSISIGLRDAEIFASDIRNDNNTIEFYINDRNEKHYVKLNSLGEFSIYNALLAYGVTRNSGVRPDIICSALSKWKGVRGRAERIDINGEFDVIIDYAHSPDSLRNIIKAIRGVCKGRVITLFGCGGNRDESKRSEMGKISGKLSDYTIITSDNPRYENPVKILKDIEKGILEVTNRYIIIPNRFDAIGYALKTAQKGDIILLAGKGHEDYIIEKNKKIHFDEREAIKYWTEKNERTDKDGENYC